jgi:hypothetical protein
VLGASAIAALPSAGAVGPGVHSFFTVAVYGLAAIAALPIAAIYGPGQPSIGGGGGGGLEFLIKWRRRGRR